MTDEQLKQAFEFNKNLTGQGGMNFEDFTKTFRHQEMMKDTWNSEMWENNRPSSYETWQQIAKVILTNDTSHYNPTLQPNTHWSNWPDSGSM